MSQSLNRQRMRINVPPVSPRKLITRPKSALELGHKGLLPQTVGSTSGQKDAAKDDRAERASKPFTSQSSNSPRISVLERPSAIGQDTLRMFLEAPWAITGAPPSPRSSLEGTSRSRLRPKLRTKNSSSTLALQREPSPGLEEQTIDAIIDGRPLSRRSNLTIFHSDERSSVTGRTTPGQRMAERFLRDRNILESGKGTPCSKTEQEALRTGPTGAKLEREDTPAFL